MSVKASKAWYNKDMDNDRSESFVILKSKGPTFRTSGRGLWTCERRDVKIKRVEVHLCKYDWDDDAEWYGEMRVHFTKASWDISRHGLIYTDQKFERQLVAWLNETFGPGAGDVGYSEQGMQHACYVSLDIGKRGAKKYLKMHNVSP